MGVVTGIPLQFQFATHLGPFTKYLRQIFGKILSIEGMSAFFIESALIGLYYAGYRYFSKKTHVLIAWGICVATHLSGFWILSANAWMQKPVGVSFGPDTCTLNSLWDIVMNDVAQAKFFHTMVSGHMVGAMFVMMLGAYWLRRQTFTQDGRTLLRLGSVIGLWSAIILIVSGHHQSRLCQQHQPMKFAVMEGIFESSSSVPMIIFSYPDAKKFKHHYCIQIPCLLSILTHHSCDKKIMGIKELMAINKRKIELGDTGFDLLKKCYPKNESSLQATVPTVVTIFYGFRVMVGIGFLLLAYFIYAVTFLKKGSTYSSLFLTITKWIWPLPWLAILCGWFVVEHGRQPWVVYEKIPTQMAILKTSNLSSIKMTFFMLLALYIVVISLSICVTKKIISQR
jgi:cytochrome d ubiquinol oxidase subunit I